jgi:creatinine amidohydrolase
MKHDSGVWLEELTAGEARELFEKGFPVVVPLATTRAPPALHLALKAGMVAVRALAQRLVDSLPIVATPVWDFGRYPASAGADALPVTFAASVGEALANLRAAGARRIVVLNADSGMEKPLEKLAARDLLVVDIGQAGRASDELLEAPEEGRDDERETSILLALEPRAVRMDRLAAGSRASAFKGERILDARNEDIVAAIRGYWSDR